MAKSKKDKTPRNNFEKEVYKGLLSFKGPNKLKIAYETEALEYSVPGKYIPDFIVEFKDGRKLYIESKGYFRYVDQVKMLAVKQAHPDLDIRMLFMRDQKLSRTSKMRYSDWCVKHKIPFAIGEIPAEWFD